MIVFGFTALRAAWERWTWAVLFSPSADFCWGVISFSVAFCTDGRVLAVTGYRAERAGNAPCLCGGRPGRPSGGG